MQPLLDADSADRSLRRLAHEMAERTRDADSLLLVGIRRGGVTIARHLQRWLGELERRTVPLGTVDITFYRDDAATRLPSPRIGPSEIPGSLDGCHVILVDDVLFTGRTIRAALDALLDYGRPSRVELAVLIDRGGRELPIQADYVGANVMVPPGQRVDVLDDDVGRPLAILQPVGAPSIFPPGKARS